MSTSLSDGEVKDITTNNSKNKKDGSIKSTLKNSNNNNNNGLPIADTGNNHCTAPVL